MKIYLFKLKILLGASLATLLLLLGIIALLLKSNFEDEGVVWFYVQHMGATRIFNLNVYDMRGDGFMYTMWVLLGWG